MAPPVSIRWEVPNGGNKLKVTWWVVLNEFVSVAMDGHWMDYEAVAVEFASRLW